MERMGVWPGGIFFLMLRSADNGAGEHFSRMAARATLPPSMSRLPGGTKVWRQQVQIQQDELR